MNQHSPDVWGIWKSLAHSYTGDEALVTHLYNDLVSHYSEPHRHYHNMEHVAALLRLYDQHKDKLEKHNLVLFSIYYHDVIYTPGRGDNEYQSALFAKESLEKLKVPVEIIEEVQAFILATKDHSLPVSAAADLKYFVDFDLSILAEERDDYKAYLSQVRKEYGYLSADHFARGRKAFLQYMLNKEKIFNTGSFQAREEQARKNMQWELEMTPGLFSAT